jgi:hypothetical protein
VVEWLLAGSSPKEKEKHTYTLDEQKEKPGWDFDEKYDDYSSN